MIHTPQEKICPRCRTSNPVSDLRDREYRCGHCALQLAHLDTAANGAVRGLFGWLLDIGDVVADRYRITAVLGKGGFGVTYLVDDLRLQGKRRALKEIPELLFDEHETRLLGRLSHPAIPDIIDRLTDRGMVYLVLEFGGSRTLRIEQERHGGRIPVFSLLPWVDQICNALTYLHSQDPPVVHRDLKPENVLLDDNNRIMLIDFGIAKESSPDTVTRTLGRAVTHGFSPPEQVLGTGTDARSDVYSLGAILYSMVTGQTPTPAHERVIGRPLPLPSHYVPDIPPLLNAAIEQALSLNINARQQSIAEFAETLGLIQAGGESSRTILVGDAQGFGAPMSTSGEVRLPSVQLSSARPAATTGARAEVSREPYPAVPVPKGKRRGVLVAAGVALAALSTGAAWILWEPQPPQPAEATAESPRPAASAPAAEAGADRQGDLAGSAMPPRRPGPERDVLRAEAAGAREIDPSKETAAEGPPTLSAQKGVPEARTTPGVHDAALVSPPPAPLVPRWGAADLPSVFSDEQATAVQPERGSESLMDLFKQHRGEGPQEAEAPVAPPAAVTPDRPGAAAPAPAKVVANPPAPAPKPKPKPKAPKPPKPAAQPPSNNSGWTIIYKGTQQTD